MSCHQVEIDGGPSFDSRAPDTLLRSALRAGIGFPYECNVGGCGSCKFELLDGEVRTLWDEAPGLTVRDRQKGKRLACQSVPLGPVRVKARTDAACIPQTPPRRVPAMLEAVVDVTHDMRQFSFRADFPAVFQPGQYAMLSLPAATRVERAYSMSNLPNDEGRWQFIVRRVPQGVGTSHLFDGMKLGDVVEIDGPYGMASLRTPERDLVCIAGGSGLAPMLSIARAAAPQLRASGRRLHFFFGARTTQDRAAQRLLEGLPEFGELLHCVEVVSQPSDVDGWAGATGFVHDTVDARLGEALSAHEIYFAGPPPMVQATMDLLMLRRGVPFAQIHYDRFF